MGGVKWCALVMLIGVAACTKGGVPTETACNDFRVMTYYNSLLTGDDWWGPYTVRVCVVGEQKIERP